MPRLTLEIDNKFDQTLSDLADGGDKAAVIRSAVANYMALKQQAPVSGAHETALVPRFAAPVTDVGSVSQVPPTFLERWGVILVVGTLLWIATVSGVLLHVFLARDPALPALTGLSRDQIDAVVKAHQAAVDAFHGSVSYIFDMLVTRTAMPVATLLLGYLFGKGQLR